MAIIKGTPDSNFLDGSVEADSIQALAGNDTGFGREGNDELWGNKGDDWLNGNQDDDTVHGGDDNDTVRGGQGNDRLLGNLGNDYVIGDRGSDTGNGSVGNDELWGNEDDDWLNGNQGDDTVHGGQGNDNVRGGQGNDRLLGNLGNDYVIGDKGSDTELGSEGNDGLFGNEGDDWLNGNQGDDTVYGGQGNDNVRGGQGNDWLLGNLGNDYISGNKDSDTGNGSVGNDELWGNEGDDALYGNQDDDKINGNQGQDSLYGGQGNDTAYGGQGNDWVYGDKGNDLLYGDRGADTITGGAGNDIIVIGRRGEAGGYLTTGGPQITDADYITDFGKGEDVFELIGGLKFDDLNIFEGSDVWAGHTIIQDKGTGEYLAILKGINWNSLDGNDFTPYPGGSPSPTPEPTPTPAPTPAPTPTPAPGPVNDAPTDISLSNARIAENSAPGTAIGTLATVDRNRKDQHTYSLLNNAGGLFSLDGNKLIVAEGATLDYEINSSYSITVLTTDAAGLTYQKTFAITVGDVNEENPSNPPTDVSLTNALVDEGSANNTVIGNFLTVDPDAGDTHSYLLIDDAGGRFALNGNQLTVANGALLDYETDASHTISVRTTDATGNTLDKVFTVTVNNSSEAPTISEIAAVTTDEDTPTSAIAFTLDDEDTAAASLVVTGTSSNAALIPIENIVFGGTGANRTAIFTPVANQSGTSTITLNVSDGTKIASQSFELTVSPVNDAPILTNTVTTQTAKPDTAYNWVLNANTFTDIDAGDTLTYSATLADGSSLPSWLNFDPTTLTFSGTPLISNLGTITLKATATDSAGATASTLYDLTVTNTNNAPTLVTPIADQTATKDAAFYYEFAATTFNDADAGDILTYTATLANGSSLPSWLTFNAATRTFTGTPATADAGTLAIKVTATDNAKAAASDTFNLVVSDTNNPPTLGNAIADQIATQNTAFNYQFAGNTFLDADGDTLTYSATLDNGSPLPNWLTFNAGTRTFSGTPTPNNLGAINVKVTATDGTASVSDVFSVTVNNAPNTAPTVANLIADQIAAEDTPYSFLVPANTFSDLDAGDTLTYSASLDTDAPLPSWLTYNAATNTFTGTPTEATLTPINVKVTATDAAGASISDTYALTVTPVNDAPVLNNVPLELPPVNEDTPLTITGISVSDEDAGEGILQVTLSATNGTLSLNSTTGVSFTTGDGTADGTIVFTGTLTNVNAALASLVYQNNSGYYGNDTVNFAVSDQGNTGSPGELSDTASTQLSVSPTFVVTNTNDSGPGSLRAIIEKANAVAGEQTITFNIPGEEPHTIAIASALPDITESVIFQGTGATKLTVDGNQNGYRIFNITAGNVTFSGMKIANAVLETPLGTTANGAAINNAGTGTVSIINSTLDSNSTATGSGGAIANSSTGTIEVINSTLSYNQAAYGGGIHSAGGTVNITNSTIAGNQADYGAGINSAGGIVNVYYSTISSNTGLTSTGGIYNTIGTVNVSNTIVAGNYGANPDVYGTFSTGGYNLIGDTTASTGFGGLGDILNTFVSFGPLQDNGGTTQTIVPIPGSLTIDAGINTNAPTTDQRGATRIYNNIADIGAVEYLGPIAYAFGDTLPNALNGSAGDDSINGYAGSDTLTGGTGYDAFTYSSPLDGSDLITDFTPDEDKFVFVSASFGGLITAGFTDAVIDQAGWGANGTSIAEDELIIFAADTGISSSAGVDAALASQNGTAAQKAAFYIYTNSASNQRVLGYDSDVSVVGNVANIAVLGTQTPTAMDFTFI